MERIKEIHKKISKDSIIGTRFVVISLSRIALGIIALAYLFNLLGAISGLSETNNQPGMHRHVIYLLYSFTGFLFFLYGYIGITKNSELLDKLGHFKENKKNLFVSISVFFFFLIILNFSIPKKPTTQVFLVNNDNDAGVSECELTVYENSDDPEYEMYCWK